MTKNGKDKKTTALEVLSEKGFAIAKLNAAEFAHALQENFGDEKLGQRDLDKIQIPTGSTSMFMVPDLEEGEKSVKTIEAVIVYYRVARAYWEKSLDDGGGNSPPDCYSNDGKMGIGKPGGSCIGCPLNEFESAKKGKGKACQERKLLFLMMPDSLMPRVLSLPPTSLSNFKKYLTRLTSGVVAYPGVITEIGLTKDKNNDGIEYHQATFKMARRMEKSDIDHIRTIIAPLRGAFEVVVLDQRDRPNG